MPVAALQKLRQQYPQYSDIPDTELARRILVKYPQYQDILGDVAKPPATVAPASTTPQDQPQPGQRPFLHRAAGFFVDPVKNESGQSFGSEFAKQFADTAVGGGITPAMGAGISAATGALAGRVFPAVRGLLSRGAARTAAEVPAAVPGVAQAVAPVAEATTQTAQQRVLQALKAAGPIRTEQESLYTAERGKRLGTALRIGAENPTPQGTTQQLASLRGPLPKPQFSPLNITEADQSELVKMIEDSPAVAGYAKIRARAALQKLFGAAGGEVPQQGELDLLGKVFGNDFVKEVAARRPFIVKAENAAAIVAGTMKALSASVDMSTPFRQGIFAAARHPIIFAKNFVPMIRSFLREEAYQGVAQEVASRPNFLNGFMRQGRLALSAVDEFAVTSREESFVASQLAEKIPGLGRLVRASNRAYSGFLTKYRADIFDSLVRDAQRAGVEMTEPQLQRMGGFINAATGRGDLGKFGASAQALSTALFSPRLLASRIQLLNPKYYASLDPFTRKEALKTLMAFAGSTATILGAARMAGAEVIDDIRNADFGKIKVGNTRYDISGGFLSYLRFAGQIGLHLSNLASGSKQPIAISSVTGQPMTDRGRPLTGEDVAERFIKSKFSPLASGARELLRGETFGRQPVSIQQQVLDRFIPLILQDAYDLYEEGGVEALPGIAPGIFGVGVQTYGPKKR